jgi:hypothetical protein
MHNNSFLKRSSVSLLAVFSLAFAGSSMALATSYDCSFDNCGTSFGTATDVGLDSPVTGFVNDDSEWFEFEGLSGSSSLESLLTITNTSSERFGDPLEVTLYNSSDQAITGDVDLVVDPGDNATLTGDVPSNGKVVVEILATRGNVATFSATLDPPSVPEPAPVTAVGLGLAAIGALRLRSRYQKN